MRRVGGLQLAGGWAPVVAEVTARRFWLWPPAAALAQGVLILGASGMGELSGPAASALRDPARVNQLGTTVVGTTLGGHPGTAGRAAVL